MSDSVPPSEQAPPANRAEQAIEKALLASRWILVVFYLGLAAALGVYALSFGSKLFDLASHAFTYEPDEMILGLLGLVDAALVASLLVMVMISGYENFVSRFDYGDTTQLSWLGKLDAGSLKVKVASSIVAISSINLLGVFMYPEDAKLTDTRIMLMTGIHLVFVISAISLALLDRLTHGDPSGGDGKH